MKNFLLILIIAAAILIPSASALEVPDATIYPERISANSSFLVLVDTHIIGTDSLRVTWVAPGSPFGYGLFPKSNGKYLCYFSDTDANSTCGPTPFRSAWSNYTMEINVVNQNGETSNRTIMLEVGDIVVIPQITVENNTIYIFALTTGMPDSVYYSIYSMDMTKKLGPTRMDYSPITDKYSATASLTPGDYYIVFEATSATNFGGGVKKITIPSTEQAASGGQTGSISVDNVSLNVLIPTPGDVYRNAGFEVINLLPYMITNLTAKIPDALSNYLRITFNSTTLNVNESTTFEVSLRNIDNGMDINASIPIESDAGVVGYIPVDVKVSVLKGISDSVTRISDILDVSPEPIISGNYLETETVTKVFDLTNTGTVDVEDFSYKLSPELSDITTVQLPVSISSGMKDTATININPQSAGSYSGTITIRTSAGSISIAVSLTIYKDISSEIAAKKAELNDIKTKIPNSTQAYISSLFNAVESNLDSVEFDFNSGDYQSAERGYYSALGQVELMDKVANLITPGSPISSPSSSGGFSFPIEALPIIIVVIIIVVILAILAKSGKLHLKRSGYEDFR